MSTSAPDRADLNSRQQQTSRIPAASLLAFTSDAFRACGLPQRDAATVAGAMIEADLTGSNAHGIFRLAQYVRWLREGRISVQPKLKLIKGGPATAVVDGDNGMGHLVMSFAANAAVDLARQTGAAWVGSRRSNHAGAAGVYAAIPLQHDMIGIYGAASSANHMAPWGGAEPLIGTNPIAFAIPAGEEAPVVLDIATSTSSFGYVRDHAMQGKPIPEGWVIDRAGQPITDPRRATEGTLLPIGGYKGSGLALIIGLLAGVLNGAAFGRDVREFGSVAAGEANTGQFVIALDVARFLPLDAFAAEIDRHVRDLRASARLPGVDAIRIPGEQRRRRREDRSRNGVALAPALLAQLDELAASLKLRPLREYQPPGSTGPPLSAQSLKAPTL
jgi:L-2-hydroxycarboxylate dehydrogenase (NAD+)